MDDDVKARAREMLADAMQWPDRGHVRAFIEAAATGKLNPAGSRCQIEAALRAIETALRQPAPMWLDIASAPKDGTWFLACSVMPGWGATRIVRFKYPDDRLPIHGEGVMWPSAPTHWQPLPPAPETPHG